MDTLIKTDSISNTECEIKQRQPAQLHCSGCGAIAEASCDCGLPYVPAGVAAAKAIKAHPEKSDNAIAKEIGVDQTTVSRARKRGKHSHHSLTPVHFARAAGALPPVRLS